MNRRFKVEAPQLFSSKSIDGFFASSFNQNPLQVPEGLCLLVVDVEIDIEPLFIYVKDIRSSFPTSAGFTGVGRQRFDIRQRKLMKIVCFAKLSSIYMYRFVFLCL